MNYLLSRRDCLKAVANACVAATLPHAFGRAAAAQRSQKSDHYATGRTGVTSTSLEATTAALWALREGGNAADAYMTAAITQTVAEPGRTSIGGGFSMHFFDANQRATTGFVGPLGPAEAEPYDFNRQSPITQTGRAMPVPGFLAGIHAAHGKLGSLPWAKLFRPAIGYARNGVAVSPKIIESAKRKGALHPQGRALWIRDGEFLKPGQKLVQARLGETLHAVATDGPSAFYEGVFARNYVARARSDNGKLTLEDMSRWRELVRTTTHQPEGNYRDHQVLGGGLIVYALHLNEALDVRATGPASKSPDSVWKQIRIMEEVFLSTRQYSSERHAQFVDPTYARQRAEFVLNSPRRKVSLDAIFNTCFLVVRDNDGNIAWGTHSINTPTAFGAGILVDGVYASHAISRNHVRGSGASAPGISTSYALFKDGEPRLVTGSPGFGFVHGPYQYGTGIIEWGLSPATAMNLPRFGLPRSDGRTIFESHYDQRVFEMLDREAISYMRSRPSPSTGLVGALLVDDNARLHVVQDGRSSGFAKAT